VRDLHGTAEQVDRVGESVDAGGSRIVGVP